MIGLVGGAYFIGTQQSQNNGDQSQTQKESGFFGKTNSEGKIAFESSGSIHLIDPDGKNETVLAEGENPVWSPDGKKIAYTTGRCLNVINIDGSGKKELVKELVSINGRQNIIWSPDEQRILFSNIDGVDGGQSTLSIINTDGSNLTKIADGPNNLEGYVSDFSPDGKRIAYCKDFGKLNVINFDGTNGEEINATCESDIEITWSSDGKSIVTNYGIIDVDKKTERDMRLDEFALSPDGKRIAYVYNQGLYVINVDGTQNKKILDSYSRKPSWSPDGNKIVFSDGDNIITVNSDGTESNNIASINSLDDIAIWSPK